MMITCVCLMCMSCSSCTQFPMNTDTISLVMLLRSSAPAWNHCLCIEISFVFYIMWLSGNIYFLKMRIPFISFHFEMYRIHCTQNFSYFFFIFQNSNKDIFLSSDFHDWGWEESSHLLSLHQQYIPALGLLLLL